MRFKLFWSKFGGGRFAIVCDVDLSMNTMEFKDKDIAVLNSLKQKRDQFYSDPHSISPNYRYNEELYTQHVNEIIESYYYPNEESL